MEYVDLRDTDGSVTSYNLVTQWTLLWPRSASSTEETVFLVDHRHSVLSAPKSYKYGAEDRQTGRQAGGSEQPKCVQAEEWGPESWQVSVTWTRSQQVRQWHYDRL